MHTQPQFSDEIYIRFLGTGPSLGIPVINCPCMVCNSNDQRDKRTRSSVFIEDENTKILIDCSPDLRQQALRENITNIDILLITHGHRDHIGGFADFVKSFAKNELRVIGPKEEILQLQKVYPQFNLPDQKPFISFEICNNSLFLAGNFKINAIPGFHGKIPVYGYLINEIGYFTDITRFEQKEWDKIKNLEILIISALQQKNHPSHLSIKQAMQWISELKPKTAYISHLSHDAGLQNDLEKQIEPLALPAYDGLKITLKTIRPKSEFPL